MKSSEFIQAALRSKWLRWALIATPVVLLLVVEIYSSLHANRYFSNIQDDLTYPYMFRHFHLHNIVTPSDHTNILKYPLFWLQSVLPYNFHTLTIANLSLAIGAIIWWAILLTIVLGKKHAPFICIVLAGILFAGVTFHINFVETTIRNIEYPIGLSFILVVNSLLRKDIFSRRQLAVGIVVSLLYIFAVAGDRFMLFAFSAPTILALAIYWLQSGRLDRRFVKAACLAVGASLLGILILKLYAHLGIINLYFNPQFTSQFVSIDSFGPSFAHAIAQLISLSGADMFSRVLSANTLLYLLNFVVLIVSTLGMLLIVINLFRSSYRAKKYPADSFALSVLALSFFVTFLAYVSSNLVLTHEANGTFVDSYNSRYITLLPLLLVVGLIFFLTRFYSNRKEIYYGIVAAYVVTGILAIPSIQNDWAYWAHFANASRGTIENVVDAAKQNGVNAIVTADSLGAPVEFWSHNQIQYVSVTDCTTRFQYNTDESWNKPVGKINNTALVIDTTGLGAGYWTGPNCSLADIQKFYGTPFKIVTVSNLQGSKPIQMWVYRNDVLTKLPG